MNHIKARRYSNILAFSGLGVLLTAQLFPDSDTLRLILSILGLFVILAGVAVTLYYYRCPHCNTLLPTRTWSVPTYCPSCGKELDSND